MTGWSRVLSVWSVCAAGLAFSGCMTGTPLKSPPLSNDRPFALDTPFQETPQVVTRSQQPDLPKPPGPGTQPPSQIQQASFASKAPMSPVVKVRAWVNGKPIFDDEVREIVKSQMARIVAAPPNQRDAEYAKAFKAALEVIIDDELLMQEAVRELEKRNSKAMAKLKEAAARKADSIIAANMRQNNVATIEEFKEMLLQSGTSLESLKRLFERQFIPNSYLGHLCSKALDNIGNLEVRDYYNTHINEFMQVDRVKWQNLFIAVGSKHQTMADAKQFAQQVLQAWSQGRDIADLVQYDDGQAVANKGAGVGEIKGDIRPRDLEPYLFALKEGEFGPLVELSTGVHLFRVIKRENAGPMPFDDKMQRMIENKLKNEIVEQERKALAAELRERASIIIAPD